MEEKYIKFAENVEKAPNAALLDALIEYQKDREATRIIKAEILSRMDIRFA